MASKLPPALRTSSASSLRFTLHLPRPIHPTLGPLRLISSSPRSSNVPTWPPPPIPQSPIGPSDNLASGPILSSSSSSSSTGGGGHRRWYQDWMHSPSFQAALTTVVGLAMVFGAGVGYLQWYKSHVLRRIAKAFEPGYDPALELSTLHAPNAAHIRRREQPLIDSIVAGEHPGGYYLLVGPKGTGKGTMVLEAMRKISADGAAFCEAHPDLEVFRLRLGKALDFDYFEDWQGSLFSRADPRSGGPQLDIERVLHKLEKVAISYTRKKGRPLVMAFNNVHLFPNTPEGHALLHQLQQRAEAWAEGGIMTMIFSTDDYWCLEMLRKNASRMRVISTADLSAAESIHALHHLRRQNLSHLHSDADRPPVEDEEILRRVYDMVGGRTSYLVKVARAEDMLAEAERMIETEKRWLNSKIGLIPEHDDDVMDEQKWSSCSWLLLRHLAQKFPSLDSTPADIFDEPRIPDLQIDIADDDVNVSEPGLIANNPLLEDLQIPEVTYEEARRIMTRTDFIDPLDVLHIISIDTRHHIRADSVLILRAAQRVIQEAGFDDALDETRDRIDQIEGLHRQSELTIKEPFRVMFDQKGGKSFLEVVGLGESFQPADGDEDGDEGEKSVEGSVDLIEVPGKDQRMV